MKEHSLSARLVYHRKLRGLSQEQLAEKTKVTVRTIQRLEKGEVTPHLRTVKMLAAALNIEVDELLQLDNPKDEAIQKKWLLLLHASPFIGFVIPFLNILLPLFIWIHKRDDNPLYDKSGRSVINFQVTMTLIYAIALIALVTVEGYGFFFFVSIIPYAVLVMLANVIAVVKSNKHYYPLSIPFLSKNQRSLSNTAALFLVLTFVPFSSSPSLANTVIDSEPNHTQQRIAEFRQFLQTFRVENKIPSLSVALVRDGEIIMSEAIGFQDHDAEEPTTEQTTYLAASITKTFTAATLLAMDADGHIDLDADFTSLSDWDRRCDWLSNSNSIFGGGTLDNGYEVPAVKCETPITLRQVLQHQVQGEPGTRFFYNPIVFGRLSNWIEENTDKPWRYWVHKYVIDAAKLEGISAGWRDPYGGDVLVHLAPPFRHAQDETDRLAPSVLPNTELNASSGIIASARALANYSIALDQGKILPASLKQRMWTPSTDEHGEKLPHAYGWFVQNWQGKRLVWHGGWWPDAYAGLLLKAPDDGLALIALSNSDGLRYEINSLTSAQIEKNPLALRFLELFVSKANQ